MSKQMRVIARLDVKSENVIKGVHFEGLKVIGLPWELALKYIEQGADELLYLDTVASLYGRNNLYDVIKKTAEHVDVPITAGGGVRSLEDIDNLLETSTKAIATNKVNHMLEKTSDDLFNEVEKQLKEQRLLIENERTQNIGEKNDIFNVV